VICSVPVYLVRATPAFRPVFVESGNVTATLSIAFLLSP
jgi:hypothetical protein